MRNTTSTTPKSLRTYSLAAVAFALLLSACEGEILGGSADPTFEKSFSSVSTAAPERTVAGQALLVVGDVDLEAGDDDVRDRLESLGFAVTVKRAGQTQAADASGMDLVVITSTTPSVELGSRLRDVAVPMVISEDALFDDMKMTGNVEGTDHGARDGECKLDVVAATHPIAQAAGLTVGERSVVNGSSQFRYGKPGSAAAVIARLDGSSSKAAVFAYDKGAALVGGGSAAARRVGLFLADDTAERLNDTGWAVFDAAAIWASGLAVTEVPEALLVVGNTSLSSGDAAVRDRLAGLGLRVVAIKDSAVQAADTAGRALIVVSETVDSPDIGGKLRDVAVPLVSFEEGLYDDLKLTGTVENTDFGKVSGQRKLNVSSPTHPIAVDAAVTGLTTVTTQADDFHFGKPVAGAQIVATLESGKPALFTFEAGTVAPARRVGAWLADKTAARLDATGGRLFDATIRWALGTAAPAGQAVLVVGNVPLSAADAAARNRLVALGYGVSLRTGPAVQVGDTVGKAVVVISSTTTSADVGSRLRDVAVPLVSWEPALFDDLRLTGSGEDSDFGGVDGQRKLDVKSPLHPIAVDAGVAAGSVTVTTQEERFHYGRPVDSAQIVARLSGSSKVGLFAFEAGAALRGGAAAPARRVGLWLGDTAASRLTSAGGKLFDASIRWAVATRAILVTGDHDLEKGDRAARDRIAALGFTVEVWHQDALAALSTSDVKVVVIGESVQSAEVGDRFTAVAVPLVVGEAALFDDLGMTAASDQGFEAGQTKINIVSPGHPLAAGFPAGLVTVQNPANDLAWGRPAAGAVVVARAAQTTTGRASIFAYETGALMVGRTAPARRVGHFFFRADQLTGSGGKLFDAAILWAANGGGPVCVPATETCNGVDDDCDGAVDEGVTTTFYRDADGDGVGAASPTQQACSAPAGYVAVTGDCADANPTRYPGAPEVCDDVDEDCDGAADEGIPTLTSYKDADGDGFGAGAALVDCAVPAGHVLVAGDCADGNPARFPGATETCNLVDDDCDAQVDEGVKLTFYPDVDHDGFGAAGPTQQACAAPSGHVATTGDCADNNPARYPGAPEVCNDVDEDCDGSADEGLPTSTYYKDADGDGYGTSSNSLVDCAPPSGYVLQNGDCADNNIMRNPGAPERCNDIDDNCNTQVDENAIDAPTWHPDADLDGFGASATSQKVCDQPTTGGVEWIEAGGDCNDNLDFINPGATEICDGVDNNCAAGETDAKFFRDVDDDGFGAAPIAGSCASPPSVNFAHESGDCNDTLDTVHPGADETCNTLDDDCDGFTDEDAVDAGEFYVDADGDGLGDPNEVVLACGQPAGTVLNDDDCDDTRPLSTEIPGNGIDEDCNPATGP